MYQITFQFENGGKPVIVDAAPNTSLLDVAKAANVAIDAPCNGNGSCGKCRVKILEGTVDSTPTHHISEEDYAAGWRLELREQARVRCGCAGAGHCVCLPEPHEDRRPFYWRRGCDVQ